jgi:hypothetical protein
LKVFIVKKAPQKIRRMITAEFPADWKIVTVPAQSLVDEIGDADALIPEGSPVDVQLLEHANNLKIIQTGAGYDNVNIAECRRRGIRVANADGINIFETEPLPVASPLGQLENVIPTPHNAGEPDALFFQKKRFRFFAGNIARVFAGEPPLNELQPINSDKNEIGNKIPAIILPEGYSGKILLVSISGAGFEDKIILRSGDLWHREILRNTEAEIRNLGFHEAGVFELGGAHLRFEPDGTIVIHGTSEQYGACDKEYAAGLVTDEFPDRRIDVRS